MGCKGGAAGLAVGIVLVLPVMAAVPPPSCPPAPAGLAASMLTAHTYYRQSVGVGALRWSDQLACAAQSWATHLAGLGGRSLMHASAVSRANAGENLWLGTQARFSYRDMLEFWANERRAYRGEAVDEGNVARVGHYTQMVWSDTREIGCAVSRAGGNDILVCRYRPAGNVVGQAPYAGRAADRLTTP